MKIFEIFADFLSWSMFICEYFTNSTFLFLDYLLFSMLINYSYLEYSRSWY